MSPESPSSNKILFLLAESKRTLTITDISKTLGYDRRTVAKILNMLLLSGRVEMRQHGQKKKFYLINTPAPLLPLPSLLPSHYTPFIFLFNTNLSVKWANAEGIQIVGIPLTTLVGKRLNALSSPLINNNPILSRVSALQQNETCTFEYSALIGDVPVPYLYTLAHICISEKEQFYSLTGHDMTGIKKIEDQLSKHESQLKIITENMPGAIFR
ncbi:MAG TPA: hypothetical protein VN372_11775, partial [Methanospirillum sp.]|nr:hypothetical protein [Methanospirillum sp.]